jgi:hypothetical protein
MMKTLLTTIFSLITLIAFSQASATSFIVHCDSFPDEFHWQIEDLSGNVLYSQNPFLPNQATVASFYITTGNYRIHMTDDGCNGMTNASFTITNDYSVVYVPVNCGCDSTYEFYIYIPDCEVTYPACSTDLDHDGFTGVSDLLIFIEQYGQTCD